MLWKCCWTKLCFIFKEWCHKIHLNCKSQRTNFLIGVPDSTGFSEKLSFWKNRSESSRRSSNSDLSTGLKSIQDKSLSEAQSMKENQQISEGRSYRQQPRWRFSHNITKIVSQHSFTFPHFGFDSEFKIQVKYRFADFHV